MKLVATKEYSIDRTWVLSRGDKSLAIIYMDYLDRVEKIVLKPNIKARESDTVLKLTLTYQERYEAFQKNSETLTFRMAHENVYTVAERVFIDQTIPEKIRKLNREDLVKYLKYHGISIIKAIFDTFTDVLDTVVGKFTKMGLNYKLSTYNRVTELNKVVFTVSNGAIFSAWHSVGRGSEGGDLYIVPNYHPDTKQDRVSNFAVNGDTDALISGTSVRAVYKPTNSADIQNGSVISSWSQCDHPFYVKGSNVTLEISPTKALSKEGSAEIISVLSALLELKKTYLSVSGGFCAPLEYPSNVLSDLGITGMHVRGSEGFCVWSYRVLKDEGELEKSYIPDWFMKERWLKIYSRN